MDVKSVASDTAAMTVELLRSMDWPTSLPMSPGRLSLVHPLSLVIGSDLVQYTDHYERRELYRRTVVTSEAYTVESTLA